MVERIDYPEGAVRSQEELEQLTTGVNGILYYVRNGRFWGKPESSFVKEYKFSRGAHVEELHNSLFFILSGESGVSGFEPSLSLLDGNITGRNAYNDHFVFTDKDHAAAYLEQAKQGRVLQS